MPKQLTVARTSLLALALASPIVLATAPAVRAQVKRSAVTGLGTETLSPAEQQMAWAASRSRRIPTIPSRMSIWAGRWHVERAKPATPPTTPRARRPRRASLAIAPANFEARKLEVWLLLGKHEFARALEAAKALNQQAPDDVMVYGFLADANAELGEYKAAEDAVQWMLDMRPGNLSGLTRAAYLREVFGDVDGAIDLYTAAFSRMSPIEDGRSRLDSEPGRSLLSVDRQIA